MQKITAVTAKATKGEIIDTLPALLDDVIAALRESSGLPRQTEDTSEGRDAAHGRQRLRLGFTIKELVHDYGAMCDAVASMAEQNGIIAASEYKILNQVLDIAIAQSVDEFSEQRARDLEQGSNAKMTEHLGVVAHELRNAIATAILAFDAIRNGRVATKGRTSEILRRSLERLKWLVDRSLMEVRLRTSSPLSPAPTDLRGLLEDVEASATIEADARSSSVAIEAGDDIEVVVDRHLLISAIANLVQNGVKYSPNGAEIIVRARRAKGGGVTIEVDDECGGLPEGKHEDLFRPFVRGDESEGDGLGLGLTIVRRAVEAHGGEIHVRDRPGTGCTFVIGLPAAATSSAPER